MNFRCALAFLPLAACVGSIGDGALPGHSPASTDEPSQTTPTSGPARCGAPAPSTLLTREQYVTTLGDLLGFDPRALVTFEDGAGRTYQPGRRLAALQAEAIMNTAAA